MDNKWGSAQFCDAFLQMPKLQTLFGEYPLNKKEKFSIIKLENCAKGIFRGVKQGTPKNIPARLAPGIKEIKGEITMKKHKFTRFLLTCLGAGLLLHWLLKKLGLIDENASDYAEEDW